MGFLCVSLRSSTIQLYDSLDSRRACACSVAAFSSQNGDCAWGLCYRRAALCCALFYFVWVKGLNAKIFIKKCFLFAVGSACRVKRFTTGWQTFRWWRRVWNWRAEVAETKVERLICCGFRLTGRAMGQVYQCWWRICREINVFPVSNITYFTFISICDLFTGSLSYIHTYIHTYIHIKSVP
jgi:hypothetical protein